MSWRFTLIPEQSFTPDAMVAMEEYLARLPTYHNVNGAILIFEDEQARDRSRFDKWQKMRDYSSQAEFIMLKPDRITFDLGGWEVQIRAVADFVRFCQERWPCRFLNELERPTTPEMLLKGFRID